MKTIVEVIERIGELKIIPVVALDSANDAQQLGEALLAGGLPCAEITLRTSAGLETLRRLAKFDGLLLGAGTVHSPEQAEQVAEAGGEFVVITCQLSRVSPPPPTWSRRSSSALK